MTIQQLNVNSKLSIMDKTSLFLKVAFMTHGKAIAIVFNVLLVGLEVISG